MSMRYLLLSLLVLGGCKVLPEAKVETSNSDFVVERLGVIEGDCIVYRFLDQTTNHYVVRCKNNEQTTSTIQQGKSTRSETIQTIR